MYDVGCRKDSDSHIDYYVSMGLTDAFLNNLSTTSIVTACDAPLYWMIGVALSGRAGGSAGGTGGVSGGTTAKPKVKARSS